MMDGLPKSVRVGPHDIRIRELTEAEAAEDFGYFKTSELVIGLCKEFPIHSMAVDTLIHEIFHAIWFMAMRDIKKVTEERACSMMATALTQVIRDNPELIAWLQKTVKK